jgi:hypothetical protein
MELCILLSSIIGLCHCLETNRLAQTEVQLDLALQSNVFFKYDYILFLIKYNRALLFSKQFSNAAGTAT